MTTNLYDPLSPLISPDERPRWQQIESLDPVRPSFFIPRLENQPQDPIIDALKLNSARDTSNTSLKLSIPTVVPSQIEGNAFYYDRRNPLRINTNVMDKATDNIWLAAASGAQTDGSKMKSWDGLRASYSHEASQGDLLSEQEPALFAASQEFIIPHVRAPQTSRLHLMPKELFALLMMNVIGHSSSVYEWDSTTEKFQRSKAYSERVVIAYGFSERLSSDIIKLHLSIGSCLRRLDEFISRTRVRKLEPTGHAFLHALETVTASLRRQLAKERLGSLRPWSETSLSYMETEEILVVLTELCYIDPSSIPPYPGIPAEGPALLSRVYSFMNLHTQSSSSKRLRGTLAFLLSTASRPYFRTVEHRIGIGKDKLAQSHDTTNRTDREVDEFGLHDMEVEALDLDSDPLSFPTFFSDALKAQVLRASRGLKVLAAAAPNHPLLKDSVERRCEWVWNEDAVEAVYSGLRGRLAEDLGTIAPVSTLPEAPDEQQGIVNYAPELSSFRVFDQEPGSQWRSSGENSTSLPIDTTPFQAFLAIFPQDLPSSTPTLAHLSDAVLHPLQAQSNRLTNALLDLFLGPSLSLPSHISLLHHFVLLDSQRFTYRLRGALFSESEAYQPIGRGTRARTRAKLGIKDERDMAAEAEEIEANAPAQWGIGLGLGLSERGIWPPGGAELGFALRRVIVDSLEEIKAEEEDIQNRNISDPRKLGMNKWSEEVVKEAEWRLGFAIRDLPVNEGREDWLNPSSLAALDFLYLDYKPPLPLGALITTDILSKYQRIFNFLLRLLRVETVSRGLFHSLIKAPGGLEKYRDAYKLLLRFRFQTHAFVSSLITYVFDTAIGIHFNAFTRRLEDIALKHSANSQGVGYLATDASTDPTDEFSNPTPIADVFEIMEDHSRILDKVLGGCMLRTQQRAISELLDDILGIVLRLGTLVRDWKRGSLKEDEAQNQLQKLHYNFERKMITLTKVLRAMDDRSELRSLLSALATSDRDHEVLSRNAGSQKREVGLSDLLIRLDLSEWWKAELERKAKAKREREASIPILPQVEDS